MKTPRRALASLSLIALFATTGCAADPGADARQPPEHRVSYCEHDWSVSHVTPEGGHDLQGGWSSGPDDAWAIDAFGRAALHWNGATWSPSPRFHGSFGLMSISGAAPDDLWAGGDAALLHWDGAGWTSSRSESRYGVIGVFARASNDVWAVGGSCVAQHWDGERWSRSPGASEAQDACDMFRVWASAPDDAWAVGDRGLWHFDGARWSGWRLFLPHSPVDATPQAIWGSAADDIWVVAEFGVIGHWNGELWSRVPSDTEQDLYAVWGSGPNDVWAAGDHGTIVHWDGAAWSRSDSGVDTLLQGIWGSGEGDVWAAGVDVILRLGCGSARDD
jgi:hypothetical protein